MSLCADPPACVLPATGGTSHHKLITGGNERLIFKIKSSNNTNYRITPVFGYVEPGVPRDIVIARTRGSPKADKLAVQYTIAPRDAHDPQAAFANLRPIGFITIPMNAFC
uniref:MSP domain-containing protein n=1 Tax=Caenorhabditis japonica TaxID=281687 RepID=A0A8R1HLH9_CAEJA